MITVQANTKDAYPGDVAPYPAGSAVVELPQDSSGGYAVVAGQVYASFLYGPPGQTDWTPDSVIPAGPMNIARDTYGIRFRSFVPGTPVAVFASLFRADEPAPTLMGLGGVTIDVVGPTLYQHNAVAVGSEAVLDFEDSATVVWAAADVPGTKVTVTPSIPANVALPGAPTTTTPATADNSTKIATTAYVQAQGYVTALTAPVTSVDGRTGAVTGLADLTSASAQVFTGAISTGPTSRTLSGTQTSGWIVDNTGQMVAFNTVTFALLTAALTTDTVARFGINSSGLIQWGPGGSTALDTQLTRNAAGRLILSSTAGGSRFDSVSAADADFPFTTFRSGDSQPKFAVRGDGSLSFGPGGSTALDTPVGRLAATVWGSTTSSLSTGPLNNGRTTAGAWMGQDARFLSTQTAVTNACLAAAVVGDTGWRISADLNIGGSAPGIVFGTGTGAGDTNIHRGVIGSTGLLAVTGTAVQNGSLQADGNVFTGFVTSAQAATSTYTPDALKAEFHTLTFATAGGTLTLANPTNPPTSAAHTGRLVIRIVTSATGATAMSYGSQYVSGGTATLPASIAAATEKILTFMADYTTGSILWRLVAIV